MKKIYLVLVICLLSLGFLINDSNTSNINAAEKIAVIVNKDNKDKISAADIRRIYLGRQKNFSFGNILLLDNSDNKIKKDFLKKFVKTSLANYKKYWVAMEVRGKGRAPKQASGKKIMAIVKKFKNVIAYVPASMVNRSVRVIATK